MGKLVVLFTIAALLAASAAHADDIESRLARQCPATEAWVNAHPSREHDEKAMKAYDAAHRSGEPALRKELAERFAKDQNARDAWIAAKYGKASGQAMMAVDASNLAWLKPLIAKHGFPTVGQVGEEGVAHAWMLVQHATHDPVLQERVLREIQPLLKTGEISKDDYALLADRVRVEQGKPQIYGTQFYVPSAKDGQPKVNKNGTPDMQLRPLENPGTVDQRRASLGLMPLADYECMLQVMYTPTASPKHKFSKSAR